MGILGKNLGRMEKNITIPDSTKYPVPFDVYPEGLEGI